MVTAHCDSMCVCAPVYMWYASANMFLEKLGNCGHPQAVWLVDLGFDWGRYSGPAGSPQPLLPCAPSNTTFC